MADSTKDESKRDAFVRRVRDFASTYGDEYTSDYQVAFFTDDLDDLRAKLTLDFFGQATYEVPITTDDDGNAAIEIGDAGTLSLDGHGLYAYLFDTADHARRDLAAEVEELRADIVPVITANGAALASSTEGMQCPRCQAHGPFNITVTARCR